MKEFSPLNCSGFLLFILIFQSCQKTPVSNVIFAPEVNKAAAVLLSEIHQLDDHSIKCPLKIENLSPQVQQVRLIGTGCSCYGVNINGKRIEKGETFELLPKSSLSMEIAAQAPSTESLQKYRASVELPNSGRSEVRQLFCELRLYNDLKIFPKVLICDTELGKTISTDEKITIERIFRSETGVCPPPELKNFPDQITLQELQQTQAPVQLEDDIWRAIWVANLKIQVAGDLSPTGETSSYAVTFPTSESTKGLSSTSKIIRRVRIPIQFPREIHFGKIPVGEKRKRSLFLSSINQGTFRIRNESNSQPDNLMISLPEELAAKYKLELFLEATKPGVWSHQLLLKTDLDTQPEIEIQLNATFLAPESD